MLPETLYHNREVSDIDYLFTYEENREVKSASERRKAAIILIAMILGNFLAVGVILAILIIKYL